MKIYPLCDPYLWEEPKVLLRTSFFIKPHKEGECVSELVNHVIYTYLIAFFAGIILMIVLGQGVMLAVMLLFGVGWSAPALYRLATAKSEREGFQGGVGVGAGAAGAGAAGAAAAAAPPAPPRQKVASADVADMYDVIGSGISAAQVTLPTARNPFMNVLLDEIKYHPTRPEAVSVLDPSVKVSLDDFFRTGFYSDPTDVFGKTQSQRQFITMPSTSIPNDQHSYQNWLYKIPGKTCKEGGREACLPGTDGGALPWMNVDK